MLSSFGLFDDFVKALNNRKLVCIEIKVVERFALGAGVFVGFFGSHFGDASFLSLVNIITLEDTVDRVFKGLECRDVLAGDCAEGFPLCFTPISEVLMDAAVADFRVQKPDLVKELFEFGEGGSVVSVLYDNLMSVIDDEILKLIG
jgi:hypothetical protein